MPMIFETLALRNYGSFYGEHIFDLRNRGLTLILGDNQDEMRMNSNGSGKSSLLESLDWCLWGVIPKGDHVDSIVNLETGKETLVSVTLKSDDGKRVTITRTRKADSNTPKLSLVVGKEDLTALDASETQVRIERVLGMGRDVFHSTVFFAQSDFWNFADATDNERMALLTKILQLNEIDALLEGAKYKSGTIAQAKAQCELEVSRREGQIEILEQHSVTQADVDAWDKNHAGLILEVETSLKELPQPRDMAREMSTAATLAMSPSPLRPSPLEYDRLKAEARRLVEIATKPLETHCDKCGQPVDTTHAAVIQQIAKENAQSMLQLASEAKEKFETEEAEYALKYGIWMQETVSAKERIRAIEREQRDNDQLIARRSALENRIAYLRKEVNPLRQQLLSVKQRLNDTRKELEKFQKEHEDIANAMKYVDFWVKAFGAKGLKSYILDSRLQEMTDAANEWVSLLTGGTIWIRFETQTKGRSTSKLSNKLNIRVFRYNPDGSISEQGYRSWSGGEKQRVSMGIDFGLSHLVAKRASKQYDLLILDEVFKHLDQSGREAVVEMLNKLKYEKSSILVVSHDNEFCGAFENRVLVRKKNRRSHIVEDYDDSVKEKPRAKVQSRRLPRRTPVKRRNSVSARQGE